MIPVFREPESGPQYRMMRLFIYSLSAACILLFVLFRIHKEDENPCAKDKYCTIYSRGSRCQSSASDQEFVIQVYDDKVRNITLNNFKKDHHEKSLDWFSSWRCLHPAAFSQKLVDIYRKGTVKLVPDTEYGKGNDWNKVFATYLDTIYNKPMGDRKNITIMPDGSIVVSHQYRNFYSLFSPDGKFMKEFEVKNSKGVPFKKTNQIMGIVNNKTFYTGLDNMGNMICFDFNGDYQKTLKLNYMTFQMVTLPNNRIALVGWVIWKEKFRDFVSIVNFDTNEEKVVWEHYTDRKEAEKENPIILLRLFI